MSFTVSKNGRLALLNVATQVSLLTQTNSKTTCGTLLYPFLYLGMAHTFRACTCGTCRTVCW